MTVSEKAEAAVDEIVADLRCRKLLKWIFCEDPDSAGDILPGLRPLDEDVQNEIYNSWQAIIEDKFAEPSK